MKAPISKKVQAILADKIGSKKLVQTVVVNNEEHLEAIQFGDKKYALHRIQSVSK